MNKKTFILILIVVLLIGSGVGYYFYAKKTTPVAPPSNPGEFAFGNQVNNAGTPTPNIDTPTPVSFTGVFSTPNPEANPNNASFQKLEPVSINNSNIIIAMTGGVVFDNATSTAVRYMERGTGHVFERTFSSSTPLGLATEISNTTIPRIHETLWISDGHSLITRYTKDDSNEVDTFFGILTIATSSESEPGSIDGNFLDTNINELALSGKNKIFTIENILGQAEGFISNPDGKKQTMVFKSPLTEWSAEWPKEGTIALTTKASAVAPGFLFFLNTANGNLKKVLANKNGLTTSTNSDTSYVLYSESTSNGFTLNTLNVKTGEENIAPLQTLPEKCVWSKYDTATAWCLVPKFQTPADYPDSWYQGKISFTDDIWKMNIKTGESQLLLATGDTFNFDGIKLFTNQTEDHLFFTNKKNMTLWSYDLR